MNGDDFSLIIVWDSILLDSKVKIIANRISKTKIKAHIRDEISPLELVIKNIVIIAIRVGYRPLQGIRLLVIMANNLSFLFSIIRQPVTPTALQPIPIHIVRACLPQELHLDSDESMLKAILGRRPISSNIVNKGKNISIGGSMTLTTQAVVLYKP